MQKIETKIMNIGELFTDKKYTIGYFQRDYSWEESHIQDLIDDLFNEFHLQKENDDKYITYFLGPIIVSEEYDELSLIDGQQRLTSLSLILIWIAKAYPEISEYILPLIFKKEGEEDICTLHVEERTPFMKFLYTDEISSHESTSTSVQNIVKQFGNINKILRDVPKSETIEFTHWLKNHVYIAQIKTASEKDADKIFESANDRGVKLSPVDIFKSYILSNVKPDEEKEGLDKIWRSRMAEISNAKESDESAIKYWLRSCHAKSSNDFDEIGGDFHRWIKRKVKNDDSDSIGLKKSDDFSQFIEVYFNFYTRWYLQSNKLAKKFETGNEAIFCNQTLQYTFQHQIILSALNPSDNDETALKKIKLVSTFIDIVIARRLWNRKPVSHSSLESYMRNLIDLIRGEKLDKILSVLQDKLLFLEEEFNYNTTPRSNRHRIFLARFSAWLDEKMGNGNSNLEFYIKGKGYDVEHIIPDNYGDYKDIVNDNLDKKEFDDESDFLEQRNSLGALLLLSSSNNRSYNARSYEEKLIYYIDQDMILAKTLCRNAYERNPRLNQIKEKYVIKFEPHDNFLTEDITKRERVYTQLAQAIWNSNKIHEIIN